MRAVSEFNFNAQVERVHCRPWGLYGGHAGAGNQVSVQVGTAPELRFPSGKVLGRLLRAGDAYILRSGGGGGYGSALDRPLDRIAFDLEEAYISKERAEACYGVVFHPGSTRIDAAATATNRQQLRAVEQSFDINALDDETPEMSPADERMFTAVK